MKRLQIDARMCILILFLFICSSDGIRQQQKGARIMTDGSSNPDAFPANNNMFWVVTPGSTGAASVGPSNFPPNNNYLFWITPSSAGSAPTSTFTASPSFAPMIPWTTADDSVVIVASPSTVPSTSVLNPNYFISPGPNWGNTFGVTTSSNPPAFTTAAPSVANKIYQDKCNSYYNTGTRFKRRAKVQVFIVGGSTSNQKEFPHMAALGYGQKTDNNFLCGGSLISEKFVLTAAHCLDAQNIGPVQFVRLGTTTLTTETLNSQDYNVIRRIPHPNFVAGQQYNDIALLELERPVAFSDYITPICLYDGPSSTELQYTKLTAIGWGKTDSAGSLNPDLQKVELDYFSYTDCNRSYSVIPKNQLPNGILENSQICAGTLDGSRDTCQGDSGGPLEIQQNGRMYIVGITSFGIGCAKVGTPGVYTKVSWFIPWISSTVWGS